MYWFPLNLVLKSAAQCLSSRRAALWSEKALKFRVSGREDSSESCVVIMLPGLRYRDTYKHFVRTCLLQLQGPGCGAGVCFNND